MGMQKAAISLVFALLIFYSIIPAQATTIFSDNFNRSNGPLDEDWQVVYGTWTIENQECSQDDGCPWRARCVVRDSIWTDFTVTVKARIIDGWGAGILFRYDGGNWYEALIRQDIDVAAISKRVVGSPVQWIKRVSFACEEEVNYTLKVEVDGNKFRFYIDDVLIVEASDSAFCQGKIGLTSIKAHVHFDDMVIVSTYNHVIPEPAPLIGLTLCITALVCYILVRRKPKYLSIR